MKITSNFSSFQYTIDYTTTEKLLASNNKVIVKSPKTENYSQIYQNKALLSRISVEKIRPRKLAFLYCVVFRNCNILVLYIVRRTTVSGFSSIYLHSHNLFSNKNSSPLVIHTLTLINIHTLGILCSELHTLFFAHQSSLLQKIMQYC